MSTHLAPLSTRTFDRLNQMMEELWSHDPLARSYTPTPWMPPVDIHETQKEFTLKMDLPGFELKDIDVEVCGDTLSISGNREQKVEENKDGQVIRFERRYGSFQRSFILSSPVKPSEVKANFKHGVLTLLVPKIEALGATKVPVRE